MNGAKLFFKDGFPDVSGKNEIIGLHGRKGNKDSS